MGYIPFPIGGPFVTGWDTDDEPWIAPPDSFSEINNAHIHHKYIEKRSGYRIFGYMTYNPSGVTYPTITNITQANPGVVTISSAVGLANGNQIYINNVTGMTEVNNNLYQIQGLVGTTFNLTDTSGNPVDTSGFTAYAGGGVLMLAPGNRMMGIYRYIKSDNTKDTLIFDTKRAAIYDATNNRFNPLDTADIMSGGDTDFIWAENWQSSGAGAGTLTNRLYFTNGKVLTGTTDGIRFYDAGASLTATQPFIPALNTGNTRRLWGCKLIFAIKQRLLVLHTFERDTGTGQTITFPQRARWCAAQNPNNWDDVTPGGGGFVDAPTGEQIVSARALQDRIIVFFTNSVWQIRLLTDPALPFRWEKINDFRACDGKMATVQYDRYVIAIGIRGITMTDGVETRRIDDKIQDFVIDDVDAENFGKVFCSRDYANTRFWSLYTRANQTENTNALIFDDESRAYSTYNASYTVLGYGNFGTDYTLADFTAANKLDLAIQDFSEETLQSYFWQKNAEAFLAGDINGIVYVLATDGDDNGSEITMNLTTAAWNPTRENGAECQLGYIDFYVDTDSRTRVKVDFFKDANTAPYASQEFDCLPNLNFISSIINVTLSNPISINSPQHGLSTGDTVYIYGVEGTTQLYDGPYVVTVVDSNNITLDGIDGTTFSAYTTGGALYERRFYKDRIWKRVYAGGIGFQHNLEIESSGIDRPLRIHQMKGYFKSRGRRTIN